MKRCFMLLLLSTVFVACGKKDAKDLEEKTQRELVVANQNADRRAALLEADLARKQLFFTALEGTYEGTFTTAGKEFKTRMTLIPSLPPYTANRVRTVEEITADLNSLSFAFQVKQWNVKGSGVAAPCIFSQIKPDYENGQVSLIAESCANVYKISLYDSSEWPDDGTPVQASVVTERSQSLSKKIFKKELLKMEEIYVVIQPTLLTKTFTVLLKRVQP